MPPPGYGSSAKRRDTDNPKYIPLIAAAAAVSTALLGWFLWGMTTADISDRTFREAQAAAGETAPPSYAVSESRGGMYFIRIPRDRFFPAETIPVNVSSVPRAMIESNALVGIRPERPSNAAMLYREYIHKREETLKLRAPIRAGKYVIVGYDNGTVLNERTEAVRIPFTVENNSEGAFFVSLEKRNYTPSEQVLAFVSGVPREMRDDHALIGIYRRGVPQGLYSEYDYIRRESERILFRAPNEPGEYEIRAFTNGSILSDATMTARIPFTVGGFAWGSFNVTLPYSYYAPGETITVNVGGVPQYMINDGAVLGICEADAVHGGFLSFDYIVSAAGTYSFTAPDKAGDYEIRAYTNGNLVTDATLASVASLGVYME